MKPHRFISFATLLIIFSVAAFAQDGAKPAGYSLVTDSVYLYTSWERVFDEDPDTVIVNPSISIDSPTEYYFKAEGKNKNAVRKMVERQCVALALGDSVWFANSSWLHKNFYGVERYIHGFVPLYFNSKIAFFSFLKPVRGYAGSFLDFMFGGIEEEPGFGDEIASYFWLDFEKKWVREVDSDELSRLLELYGYRNLQMRFESMRDYRETYMVNDFFIQFVNMLNQDPAVPYL